MQGKLFLILCVTAISFNGGPSAEGRRADYSTSGFMSMDRIESAVQGGPAAGDHVLGNPVLPFTARNIQAILPFINFTCDGSILSWTFGARWEGKSPRYTELQIWRSSGNGSYTKVGNTTIMLEEENSTQLYQYTLTSPLPFQVGDILGFFQGSRSTSQLILLHENVSSGQPMHYVRPDSPSSQFIMKDCVRNDRFHVLVNVQTDPAGCDCGFMSHERMHILLGLETVGKRIFTDQCQQITPDITFTCDGHITKWIVGAKWAVNQSLHPELQVWRNVGKDVYHKIDGTVINIAAESPTRIYEYDNFLPIPVLAGDVLGVFTPETSSSRLKLWSERDNGPPVYYVDTGSATESSIDLHMPSLSSTSYFPLVTVEISVSSPTSSASMIMTTSPLDPTSTISDASSYQSKNPTMSLSSVPPSSMVPQQTPTAVLQQTPTTVVPQHTPPGSTGDGTSDAGSEGQLSVGAGIGAGVAAVVVLLGVGVLVVSLVIVWRMRRKQSKVDLQHENDSGVRNLDNPVYSGIDDKSTEPLQHSATRPLQEAVYDLPSDKTSSPHHPKDSGAYKEFDNPIYSDTGPASLTESNLYQNVDGMGYIYVPTTEQRRATEEQGANIYSTLTHATGNGHLGYFTEVDIYWTPASTMPALYEQLAHHKYREIPRDQVRVGEILGSGEFGVVCKGTWQCEMGQLDMAIKTVKGGVSETDRVKFLQEAAINGQFRHPNIVTLHGVVTVGEPLMLVLEYLPNGDLQSYLHSLQTGPGYPTDNELPQLCLSFCQHVVSGMVYLAGKDFVHRDLAAHNILVSEKRVCKIADFGMARDLEEGSYYVSHGGKIPTKWTAPEALNYRKYSTASDVWSFGCLMYEIWSLGHKPFEGYTNAQVVKLVSEGCRLAPPPGCPRAIYAVMMDCWHPEKSGWPTFPTLYKTLSQDSRALLAWSVEDHKIHPQATVLGAALEAGKDLHFDVQNSYITPQ